MSHFLFYDAVVVGVVIVVMLVDGVVIVDVDEKKTDGHDV